MTKDEVLRGALLLNGEDKKYLISIDGDKIITEVNYKNAILFSPASVTDTMKQFKITTRLYDDNTYTEFHSDKVRSKSAGNGFAAFLQGGTYGKVSKAEVSISFGKNKKTDKSGIVKTSFNTKEYKKVIREYLKECGYKKASSCFLKKLFKRKRENNYN